jgi:hypothetical protein
MPLWVWNLVDQILVLMHPGTLHNNATVWLDKILHASDRFTVLDLLETTDDGEYMSMRQIHTSP